MANEFQRKFRRNFQRYYQKMLYKFQRNHCVNLKRNSFRISIGILKEIPLRILAGNSYEIPLGMSDGIASGMLLEFLQEYIGGIP